MLHNPIFKGFNPDPAICRKGDDYTWPSPHSNGSRASRSTIPRT